MLTTGALEIIIVVTQRFIGLYANHNSCDHDAWQARIDANRNVCTNKKTSDGAPKPADPKACSQL